MKNYIVHNMLAEVCNAQSKLNSLILREHHDKELNSFMLNFKALLLSKKLREFAEDNAELLRINRLESFMTTLNTYLFNLEQCMNSNNFDVNAYMNTVQYWLARICDICTKLVIQTNMNTIRETLSKDDIDK
jgi:hypothetical protein